MAVIEELNAGGLTILMVTHKAELALQARRTLPMRDGRIDPMVLLTGERQTP